MSPARHLGFALRCGWLFLVAVPVVPGRAESTPPPTPASTAAEFEKHLLAARQAAKQAKFDEAMQALLAANRADPTRYEAPALAALVLLQTGQFAEALQAAADARALAPNEGKIGDITRLIQSTMEKKKQAEAERAAALVPSDEQRRHYARVMQIMADADKATDLETRRYHLDRFLWWSQSYVSNYPNDLHVWMARVIASLELERPDDGLPAVKAFDRLRYTSNSGIDQAQIFHLLDRIKERGWWVVDTTAEMVERFRKSQPFAPRNATWANSLNMGFVPVGNVLFSVYETRIEDYWAFKCATRRDWIWDKWQEPGHPAVNVSWNEAVAFCRWLTEKDRREGWLKPNQFYRLPTDAEWSFAAGMPAEQGNTPEERWRNSLKAAALYAWGAQEFAGPNNTRIPPEGAGNFGDESLAPLEPTWKTMAGYRDGFGRTAPVGKFKPNAYGLCDLSGNVSEFIQDNFDAGGILRFARGGSWADSSLGLLRLGERTRVDPFQRYQTIGFRCVLVP